MPASPQWPSSCTSRARRRGQASVDHTAASAFFCSRLLLPHYLECVDLPHAHQEIYCLMKLAHRRVCARQPVPSVLLLVQRLDVERDHLSLLCCCLSSSRTSSQSHRLGPPSHIPRKPSPAAHAV